MTGLRRLLAAAVLAVGISVGGAAVAMADCTPSGVPNLAGSGLPGLIDEPVQSPTGTLYGRYGWAGYRWYTCDLGMGPEIANDPGAVQDTTAGNVLLGGAATLGATMTQLHTWVASPAAIMAPIDGAVADVAGIVNNATWLEYAPAVIILAGALTILRAMQGDTRRAVRTVGAVFVSMLAIAWVFTPRAGQPGALVAAQQFDGVVTSVVANVDQSVASQLTQGYPGASDHEIRGATLADGILYPIWARGAVGSSEPKAVQLASQLYTAQAGTVAFADLGTAKADTYRGNYSTIAGQINDANPNWYTTLKGQSYNRLGQGFLAFAMMLTIAFIRIPAEMLVLIGLLVMRVAVMFAPIFALAGILESTRPYAKTALKMVIASVVNVAIFGIVASIHTGMVMVIIAESGSIIKSLVLILGLTVLIWMMSKPFRSATKLATGDDAAGALERAGRPLDGVKGVLGAVVPSMVGSYFGTRQGEEAAHARDAGDRTLNQYNFHNSQDAWSRMEESSDEPVVTVAHSRTTTNDKVSVEIDAPPSRLALPPGDDGSGPPIVPPPPPNPDVPPAPRGSTFGDNDVIFTPSDAPSFEADTEVRRIYLIEPEYDSDGNLTYEIFIPDEVTSS